MNPEKKENSSPQQLKEKIARLRQELEKSQQKSNKPGTEGSNAQVDNNSAHKNEQASGTGHEKNKSSAQKNSSAVKESETNPLQVIEELESEIELLLKDNIRLREEKLMALADGENLKKRVQQELEQHKTYRSAKLAEKLIPVLDNFSRALDVQEITPEVKNFLTGFDMIYKLMKLGFAEEGITEIVVEKGDPFDPDKHSAVAVVETKEVPSGAITKVLQKGYKIHERVLRHASVEVEK